MQRFWAALGIALAFSCLPSSRSNAADSYWHDPLRQFAATANEDLITARTDALETLRLEVGERVSISDRGGNEAVVDSITTTFDHSGRVRTIRSTGGTQGLGVKPPDEAADLFVKRFILEHGALWDFQGSGVRSPHELTTLETVRIAERTTPRGHKVTIVQFSQTYREIPILDGEVLAVFWDETLVRIAGTIVNSAIDIFPEEAEVSLDDALRSAEQTVARRGADVLASDLSAFGVVLSLNTLVYRVTTATGPTEENVSTFSTWVDAIDGVVLAVEDDRREIPSQAGTYRVYRPAAAATNIDSTATISDRADAHVAVSGNNVYPWRDVLANRSPAPTYDATLSWTGANCGGCSPCFGFPWHASNNGGMTFLSNPGGDNFRVQHVSYWVQRAVGIADINSTWWEPLDESYEYAKVTAVANLTPPPDDTSAYCDPNGCNPGQVLPLWRPSDGASGATPKVPCLRFPGSGPSGYGAIGADGFRAATRIGTIGHEVGHAIDHKYGAGQFHGSPIDDDCEPNTSEEASSLSETIASLYSLMFVLDEFGTGTGFTDVDSSSGGLGDITGPSGYPAHLNDNTLRCHAPTGIVCDDAQNPVGNYTYGYPLLQAYWEVAHGVNCDGPVGEACYVLPDSADEDEARWALFHALLVSPRNSTYREFVADILDYFYYDIGQQEWNDRWWIFNHHGLVGPDYAYTPCSSD